MMVVLSSPLFIPHHRWIAELGIQHRLPTMFISRMYCEAGGLMSSGVIFSTMCRGASDHVAKINKGARAGAARIEQAVKIELVVNLKPAKAIGLEVPPILLAGADEV